MECGEDSCSFMGNCYSDGSELCGEEYDFANCCKCERGRLDYRPGLLSPGFPPERL